MRRHRLPCLPKMLMPLVTARVPLLWPLLFALLGGWAFYSSSGPTLADRTSCAAFIGNIDRPCPKVTMPKCPPNECPDEVCPICDSTIGSALVEKKSKRPILDSLLAVKNAVTVRGVVQTVTITSGNAAMNSMIRNWAASIERASGDPLPYIAIPLDSIGFNGLEAAGGVNLYKDVRAHAAFSAGGSNYGDPVYGDLSAYKWRFAYELLLKGVPVLLSDPDVVFLRNPVPYFATLPKCDIYMQMDVDWPSTGESIRQRNGWQYTTVRDFFCGGFAMLTTSEQSKTQIELFLGEIGRMRRIDSKLEEQTIWNRMLTDNFTRVTPNVVDAIMSRTCITYEHSATKRRVDVWPLNPNLFPNYPIYAKEKMPEKVLEPPFIMHANWLYGIAAKEQTLKGLGMWYIS